MSSNKTKVLEKITHFSNLSPGKLYEMAVFIHTLINNPNRKFDLGMEIRLADKFDDLGIRVNGSQYTFTQIKLVDNVDANVIDSKVLLGEKRISLKKDDFKLQKYLISYLRLKDQLNSRDKSSSIHKLIIYTNAHLNMEEVSKEIGNLNRMKNNNDNIIATNEDSQYYKVTNVRKDFMQKMMKHFKCDLDVLVEEIAKYVIDNCKQGPMVLDVDCFRYYHRALIEEKVMEVGESQQGNKKIKLGKFTQNFINGNELLSKRAQNLRNKLLNFLLGKSNNLQKLHDNMAKAEWKLSDDFGSTESKDVIFLPEYEISDKDIKDFFGILELRVNQLGSKDIFMKIKHEEIKNRFLEYFVTDPKLVEFLINDFIQGWRNEETTQEKWLLNSERSDFIKKLQVKIAKPQAIHTTNKHVKYIESIIKKYNLHFRADCSFNEKYFLRKKYLVISTASNVLSSIKMLEYLNRTKHQSYIFIDLESLSDKREIVQLIDAFRDVNYSLLILTYKSLIEEDIINEIFNKLSSAMQATSNKQAVFITSNPDSLIKKFDGYQEYKDTIKGIEDFIDSSKILEQKITIQGQTIQARDLYNKICPKIIDRLISVNIVIGSNESDNMSYLEGARYELFEEVNTDSFVDELLSEKSSDIYVISGIPGSQKEERLIRILGMSRKIEANNIKSQIEVFDQNSPKTLNKKINISSDQFKEKEFWEICRFNAEKNLYWIVFKYECVKPKFILEQIYNPEFYIKGKRFNNGVAISKKIKEYLANVHLRERFFISGKNKNDIDNWLQLNIDKRKQFGANIQNEMIQLTTEENNCILFEELVEKYHNETIHFLRFDRDELMWCKSHGSLKNLSVYRNDSFRNSQYLLGEDGVIKEIKDKRVVIIAGEPGIGKSTALVKLYSSKYEVLSGVEEPINVSHWVIRVKLKDHLESIRDIDFTYSEEMTLVVTEIIKFLSQVDIGLQNDVAKGLLNAALIDKDFGKPLLIAFDGFDEILDKEDRAKVISLLKVLKHKTNVKFWITTRFHSENSLESELSAFSIRLEAMDVEKVRIFIEMYLKYHLKLILSREEFTKIFNDIDEKGNRNLLNIYTEAFLNKMQEIFKGDITWFIGTPLQLYLMLEGSARYFRKWAIDNNSVTPDFSYLGNNIYEVYENFIDRKYDTYFKKSDIKENIKQKLEKTVLDNFHKDLAKSLLLELKLKKSFEDLKDILLSPGIVRSDGRNIEFIHPTFKEYYAAEMFLFWIRKWARKSQNVLINENKFEYFFKIVLLKPVYQIIRAFINVKLLQEKINFCVELPQLKCDLFLEQILHRAVAEKNLGITRMLLINFSYNQGCNDYSLNIAASSGNIEILELLVKYKSNIYSNDNLYSALLHVAAESGDLKIVEFMVGRGANVNVTNMHGETLMHIFSKCTSKAFNEYVEIANFLIKNGMVNLNAADIRGMTAICSAAQRGNWELVKYLIEYDADPNIGNANGVSLPLFYAVISGDYDIVEFLIQHDANVNARDEKGHTVLHGALHSENIDIVKLLVRHGADVHCKCCGNASLLYHSSFLDLSSSKNISIVTFLIENELKVDTRLKNDKLILKRVAESGNLDLLKLLIETRVNIDDLDVLCPSLLHVAAQSGNLFMVKFLVESDIEIRATSRSVKHRTFRGLNNPYWIKFIQDGYFNIKDKDGNSVLHCAFKSKNFEIIKFLIENGSDVNAKNKKGETALYLAIMNKCNEQIVRYLLSAGVDVTVKTRYGLTALDLAKAMKYNNVATLIHCTNNKQLFKCLKNNK